MHRYVAGSPRVERFLVTDVFDVHVNPWPTSHIVSVFRELTAHRAPLLLSTEETCWVGHVCDRGEVERFQATAEVSSHRFMQSQFVGARERVLHMLEWGLGTGETDDMRMMYEYIRAHPRAVAMDAESRMFGSLAFATPDANGGYMCWDGRCSESRAHRACVRDARGGVCVRTNATTTCPLLWHANGLLSRAFLRSHPACTRVLGRLK